jgi:uncharacterized protein (UPF0248 family)
MILYHALPKEYADAQLDNNGFTNLHPIFAKHKDIVPAIWATKDAGWSLQASWNNEHYGKEIVILKINTENMDGIENHKDFTVKGRDYYLIRGKHIPAHRITNMGVVWKT